MENKNNDTFSEVHQEALRNGVLVLGMLAILTLGEFMVAVIAPPWTFILWIVAFAKAFFVIRDYMHVGKLFGDQETHE